MSWSLKKSSTQTEYSCYIQIHKKKKEKLYLITNFKKISSALRKPINTFPDGIMPSNRRENELINILDSHKKDSEFRFLSKELIISIGVAVSTMFLSLINF
ncbi:hypothetical protein YG12_04250 [Salmonella enterica subsp. enterica serovar Derby]|uniref:Uncharacterized protein n=2 Tax=Salmonella derby TaxID=28144 RepID=A0A5X0DFM9_SALDE|nr:hypothetical protein [Salmonella enterica]EDU1641450.1 hypothetical protein [Salmonella enterica subsp. enterica serovar Saintpaul]EDV1144331.1 hypothetical protein [Salmonella enterica subsp. enterica]EDV5162250.1 hypothetical protein [Salmonella enterica subsp. enterica serovar Hato]EED5954430.1 hypothetical protein [Salmonella enterica subsp. enterica serovar Agona]EAB7187028.1 hypothetical protein [Salmonella enterica subsp. enterica serovar Derby]